MDANYTPSWEEVSAAIKNKPAVVVQRLRETHRETQKEINILYTKAIQKIRDEIPEHNQYEEFLDNQTKNPKLIFLSEISEEYKDAWIKSYEKIPENLREMLVSYGTQIKIKIISSREMYELFGGNLPNNYGNRSDFFSPISTPDACATTDNIIYLVGEPTSINGDRASRMHELAHIIHFEIEKNQPELAAEWEEIWYEARKRYEAETSGNLPYSDGMLFVSFYAAEDPYEGFAETVTYVSGELPTYQDYSNPYVLKQIEFIKNLGIIEKY